MNKFWARDFTYFFIGHSNITISYEKHWLYYSEHQISFLRSVLSDHLCVKDNGQARTKDFMEIVRGLHI